MAQFPPARCLNCGEPLKGSFCHHCGQKATDINQPLSQLVRDLFSTVFAFDTRFFRTLRPLLFKPGLLTVEYNAGRRVRYVPPLTLFAFISFFMFVTLAMSGYSAVNVSENSGDASGPEEPPPSGVRLDVIKEQSEPAVAFGEEDETASAEGGADDEANEDTEGLDNGDEDDGLAGAFFARFFSAYEESPERFDAAFRNDLARSVFFLVPVFALMLKVLYLRSGTLYVQHLIMSFHLHSFAFLSIIVVSVFEVVIQGWLGEAVKLPILVWFWVYLFMALRRVYGDSRWRTGIKLFVLAFCYVVVLLAVLLATLVITVLFI